MRVQGALIWSISPLMSSAEPPIMYSTSLWSLPYEAGAPTRLLYAQERAFLRDLRSAIDKRVEHKIASARRFAVSFEIVYLSSPAVPLSPTPGLSILDFGVKSSNPVNNKNSLDVEVIH